jgi:uncharacterized protein
MKSPLIIPVESLHARPLHVQAELDPLALDLIDPEFEFPHPVKLDATFQIIGLDVLGQGTLDTVVRTPCVRCLTPTETRLRVPFTETWFHKTAAQRAEEEATAEHTGLDRFYEGDVLDITEDLRELLMAELPARVYCREDCKGLCPGCGANLNTEPCQCDAKYQEGERLPDWKAKLKNIKLN